METQIKELTFRNATFSDLEKIVAIEKKYDENKFDKWFSFKYDLSNSEEIFFQKLITENRLTLSAYNEEQLKMKFIGPLLYKVSYFFDDIKDWYEYSLTATVNGTVLKGKTDFMLARGFKKPKKPFFFIQEFKQDKNLIDPEDQLLAELIAAMQINNSKIMQGAFIQGERWNFLILEKLEAGNYEYFVSEGFDCLKIKDLKQIYINLQAVKKLFCK